ncbi:MAG: WXG100 family type VII secretion target [Clostridia bacterium]|nr:WXG100 family type VII secretion target [Clostridia bacterium]
MAGYTVTVSQLTQVAEELTSLNGQFQQQVGRLKENEQELDSMWDGDANTTFKQQFAKNCESLESFYLVIAKYVEALQASARIILQKEAEAVEIVS